MSNPLPAILGASVLSLAIGLGAGYVIFDAQEAKPTSPEASVEKEQKNEEPLKELPKKNKKKKSEEKPKAKVVKETEPVVDLKPELDEAQEELVRLNALLKSHKIDPASEPVVEGNLTLKELAEKSPDELSDEQRQLILSASAMALVAFNDAVESKDAGEIIKQIYELRDLGELAMTEFFKAYTIIGEQGNPFYGGNALKIPQTDYEKVMGPKQVLFAAKDDGGIAPEGARIHAAYALQHQPTGMSKAETTTVFENLVKTAKIDYTGQAAIMQLTGMRNKESGDALVRLAMDSGVSEASRASSLVGIGSNYPESISEEQVKELRGSDNNKIARAARYVSNARTPEATGYLVGSFNPGSQAATTGLQVGDIITHYNGTLVDSAKTLTDWQQEAKGKEVSFAVFRDGQTVELKAQGGPLGINGKFIQR